MWRNYAKMVIEEIFFSDIFSSHPVRDERSGLSYINMYCYLCNQSPDRPEFDFGKPWDIEFHCEKFIEHKNFIMMNRLLKTIMEAKCDVTYFPDIRTTETLIPQCSNMGRTRYRGTCNSTEKWLFGDLDIKYACEKVSSGALNQFYPESYKCEFPFKNVFCALCNPEVVENVSISECSVSGNDSFYSELDDFGCQFFPEINFYWPFKNLFCKHVVIEERFRSSVCLQTFCLNVKSLCINVSLDFQFTGIYLCILLRMVNSPKMNHLNVNHQKHIFPKW